MELDTGKAVSIVSEEQLLLSKKVRPSNVVLFTYTSEKIPFLWETQLYVEYRGQKYALTAYITRGAGPCLLGCDWLREILEGNVSGVHIQPISTGQAELDTLLKEHQEVFIDDLGTMSSVYATLKLKKDASP